MSQIEELRFAYSAFPKRFETIRRRIGNDAYRVLLYYIEDADNRYTLWEISGIAKKLGVDIPPYTIKMWRLMLTVPSRKLIPELERVKALSPLRCVHPVVEDEEDHALPLNRA